MKNQRFQKKMKPSMYLFAHNDADDANKMNKENSYACVNGMWRGIVGQSDGFFTKEIAEITRFKDFLLSLKRLLYCALSHP